jgi:hypothetical protein
MILENEVLTDCGIRPSDPLTLTRYDIRSSEIVTKIIMKVLQIRIKMIITKIMMN